MKRWWIGIGMIFLLLGFAGCDGADRPEARRANVIRLVEENVEVLAADIEAWSFEDSAAIPGIEAVLPREESLGGGFVEYDCGGAGFGPSTAYFGFYYSEDDDMTQIWCAGEPLEPSGDGFLYEEPDGDNRYYTEPIVDHFYFYEAAY